LWQQIALLESTPGQDEELPLRDQKLDVELELRVLKAQTTFFKQFPSAVQVLAIVGHPAISAQYDAARGLRWKEEEY
jgi:hypothetical protein